MNYIKRLEADLDEARRINAMHVERIHQFRVHLALPKFTEENWISVADVQQWLQYISTTDEA